ncbi:unnamed protein product [Adineta ricciae]|uniref:Uncharacterized protein n=1 Tax=Adineta ricciae TaxID=249248 RepID=A0A815SJP4_ADIRI|nr:unnamed protein product [Adineta ricciae]CAF1491591.1 unnamed protein product [Adineta ricciae]
MTSHANKLADPSLCTCLPGTYRHTIFSNIKWSTLSIITALLIIIVYLSSGLYALIDVTTMSSGKAYTDGGIFWAIASSSMMIIFGWMLVAIYFGVVLLIILLLCGIQLEKAWLLFVWSILMIFMLLADGIVTVLSLRENQQQNYRPIKQIKILFFVMIIRLIVSLCGIFVTIFHFRRLSKAQSDEINRQRMLERYNAESSSSTYNDSNEHSSAPLYASKDTNGDRYFAELFPPVSLPRANVGQMQSQPTSALFHTYNGHSDNHMQSQRRALDKYRNDFRYNVPLQERFHEREITSAQNY